MIPELQILIGSIAGGTGALLSYWAGWRARGAQRPSYSSAAIAWRAEKVQRAIDTNARPQPSGGHLITEGRLFGGYQPCSQGGATNPPPRNP